MGIAGSGLALMLAELISFIVLLIAFLMDKDRVKYHPFHFKNMQWSTYKALISVSLPLVGRIDDRLYLLDRVFRSYRQSG
jgi:Na+-driven multidrug efflux pump